MVNVGEAVGVIAAQSIGEPGTQLTLRTFHIGGTAMRLSAQSIVHTKTGGRVVYVSMRTVKDQDGNLIAIGHHGEVEVRDDRDRVRAHYQVPYGAAMKVTDNAKVDDAGALFEWDPYTSPILSDRSGTTSFVDIVDEKLETREILRERLFPTRMATSTQISS